MSWRVGRAPAVTLAASWLCAAVVVPAMAGTPVRPTLAQTIRDNTYELELTAEGLRGPGAEFLIDEARASQFVALAEPHNVEQVAQFTGGLFRALHTGAGYDYLAIEQGPLIVDLLSQAAGKNGIDGAVSVARRFPHALHFDTDQELQLIANVAVIDGAPIDRVWGLDRLLSAEHALEWLLPRAPTPEAAQAVEELLDSVRNKKTKGFMKLPAERFEQLHTYFSAPADSEASALLELLIRSHRNLRLNADAGKGQPTGYAANLDREQTMKDAFLRFYRRAEAADGSRPRVLLRFGHWHTIRAFNQGNVLTLGNLLDGFAEANGLRSFHLTIQPINRKNSGYWSLGEHPEFAPLAAAGSPDAWRVVDLRPLRDYIHAGWFKVSRELKTDIFGFDAALLIGGANRGTHQWKKNQ